MSKAQISENIMIMTRDEFEEHLSKAFLDGFEGHANLNLNDRVPFAIAEEAIVANPEKSDRAISDDIGVSRYTVAEARRLIKLRDAQLHDREAEHAWRS
jgi:hypothetical protein